MKRRTLLAVYGLAIATAVILPAGRRPAAGAEKDATRPSLAARIEAMTGARTKIVWAHQVTGNPKKWGANSPEFELMGFDTADGKTRVILPGPASFGNPSITPDGKGVVFTDVPKGKVFIVDWNGKNKKVLADGFALCTWVDSKTGVQWLYAGQAEFHSPVRRYRLDDPKVKELVWDKICSGTNGFQISADGTRSGSMFPHPRAGVAMLADGTWDQYGSGCQASFAPDNSYRFCHMGEKAGHSGVMMYDAGGANKRLIRFDNFPGQPKQDSWNSRWTTDVRFLTVSSPNSGLRQEVYIGEFDGRFTRVKRWIQVTDRPGQDVCSHAWIDPGLGRREGEVPLTVEIPAPAAGEGAWQWDFGDGAKAKGAAGRHTYKKAGSYTVVARRGETVVKGNVGVQPRKRPTVVVAELLDESNLRLRFDEPVQLKDASVKLKSGTPIESIWLGKSGLKLVVRLGGKLGKTDTLSLKGIYDRAQAPNAAQGPAAITRPAWPSDRTELALLWQTQDKDRFHRQADGQTFADTRLKPWKFARTDRSGAMELRGGLFVAVDAGAGVVARCAKTNQFTIQATITPDNLYQGHVTAPRRIISCQWGRAMSSTNFALAQERDKLVLYMYNRPEGTGGRTGLKRVQLCTLAGQAPNHVVVSYKSGELVCALNAKVVLKTDKVTGALPWRRVPLGSGLSIGGPEGARFTWRGKAEGIAMFARALSAREAAKDFAAYNRSLAKRKAIPRIALRAKLVAKSKVPSPADIAPYVDALVVNEYEVVKVIRGRYAPAKIRIAQWGLMDGKVTQLSRTATGTLAELSVELFSDHPQLEAEVTRSTMSASTTARST